MPVPSHRGGRAVSGGQARAGVQAGVQAELSDRYLAITSTLTLTCEYYDALNMYLPQEADRHIPCWAPCTVTGATSSQAGELLRPGLR